MGARTTLLRVALDPAALTPTPQARPAQGRLLGISTAQLLFAAGKAQATGASNAQCSAAMNVVGDVVYLVQSTAVTAVSAICSCAAFVIGNISP